MKTMTLLAACIDFFGLHPGQNKIAFGKDEYKKLSDDDRKEIRAGLEQNGYIILDQPGAVADAGKVKPALA
jgi:hypothetical protein